MRTKNYIEFRVYLENGTSAEAAAEIADDLQDVITDHTVFHSETTQDVTFEIINPEGEPEK